MTMRQDPTFSTQPLPSSPEPQGDPPGEGAVPELSTALEQARALMAGGDAAAAARVLGGVADQNLDSVELQEMLGAALCEAGETQVGVLVLESVVNQHPLRAPAHFNLAAAYQRAGRTEDTRLQLEVALRLDPHYQRARAALQEWGLDQPPGGAETPEETSTDAAAAENSSVTAAENSSVTAAENSSVTAAAPAAMTESPPEPPGPPTGLAAAPGAPREEMVAGGLAPSTVAPESPPVPPRVQSIQPPRRTTPRGAGAPMDVFDDDSAPRLGEMALGLLTRPGRTIGDEMAGFAESPGSIPGCSLLFALTAILWGCALVFQPGSTTTPSPVTLTEAIFVSLFCAGLLVAVEAFIAAMASAPFTGRRIGPDFRQLAIRFALIWAVINFLPMILGGVLGLANTPASPIFMVIGAVWCFPINYRALLVYYPYDAARCLFITFVAQALGYIAALGILHLIFHWG